MSHSEVAAVNTRRSLRHWRVLRPHTWGIATRSAAVSAAVVLAALVLATAGLLALLHGLLLSNVDDAAAARALDIATSLDTSAPGDLDEGLLATDELVAAIQIIDAEGDVVRHSLGTKLKPLAAPSEFGTTASIGDTNRVLLKHDMRLSGLTVTTPAGSYTVIVGGASAPVNATVRSVALLMAALSPLVIGEAAFISYVLVKRSLRSVDAIRLRVADVSASDLSGRVPVPASHDEIAALATTMNSMLERIETAHRAQRQFVGDASHELRSPLATILSTLEVVEAHPHLLDHTLVTGTLLPEAQRMRALVADLLLLARADEDRSSLRTDTVFLDAIVDAEVARLRQDSDLVIETSCTPIDVEGDGPALARMLRNLLENATRHAKTRVEVSVGHRVDGLPVAVLTVGDDGPGIPAAERHRIFDRFVRLDSVRSRNTGGAGLGLAIVKEIIVAHGGTIVVGERPGGGAVFTVVLPLRQQPVADPAQRLD